MILTCVQRLKSYTRLKFNIKINSLTEVVLSNPPWKMRDFREPIESVRWRTEWSIINTREGRSDGGRLLCITTQENAVYYVIRKPPMYISNQ